MLKKCSKPTSCANPNVSFRGSRPNFGHRTGNDLGARARRRGLRAGNDQSQTVPVRLVYQYLEGGLLTTYSPLRKARAVYFLGGLSMSRLMPLAHIYLKDIPQPSTLNEHFTQDNDFEVRNRTQWLLNLGVGVSKSLGKGKAFVECRMQQSISDTYKTDAIRGGVAVLAMNVGYQYNL